MSAWQDALSSQEGGEKAALLWCVPSSVHVSFCTRKALALRSSICLVAVYITCDVGVNLCSEAATQRALPR